MASNQFGGGGARPHGRLSAAEAGALAGVSGTTIGQWARWGYIRSSQSSEEPRVYSVEDVAEAAIVAELLGRGVAHAGVRAAIERLRDYGRWPLSEARLATTAGGGRPRIALHEDDGWLVLTGRGWQAVAHPDERQTTLALDEVRLRLRREAAERPTMPASSRAPSSAAFFT
jgi:DNA-binding transcriptional MerR regulator